ncbi:MAG: GPR endopeptidase [Clostridia bacterium]|nr:GPR endopeptidase [Clostridia bacterium]
MMHENYYRTDLACEIRRSSDGEKEPGVCTRQRTQNGIEVLETDIEPGEGETRSGRAAGRYITIFAGKFWLKGREEYDEICGVLSDTLRQMTERTLPHKNRKELKILIAGLGNRFITSDALGPLTVDRLIATRHIRETNTRLFHLIGNCEISLIAPGVIGQTGFEAAEMILGAAKCAEPDLILAIDALAARSCHRLGTTVQLSNRGIMPGAGIGNHRQSIDQETMGTPVFSLGIPTVVSSSALILEAMEEAAVPDAGGDRLSRLLKSGESFFVSPKECDTVVAEGAKLFSDAIQSAFRL